MSSKIHRLEGDISAVSNELEFFLHNITADVVLKENTGQLELSHEVNLVDTIELMISMAQNVGELNTIAVSMIRQLHDLVEKMGGNLYAGSSLLRDTSDREPSWYRTTCLSHTLAQGFLTTGSQQLVIGVAREGAGTQSGEVFGMRLYNFLRQLTPLILSLSATSPYRYHEGNLQDSGYQSHRPRRYQTMSSRLPAVMFSSPRIDTLEQFETHLQQVSDAVNHDLRAGRLDSNDAELYRNREERTYAPFAILAPHQIYSWVRIRPDHANADAIFSLELRVSDISSNTETIQSINSFITGLSYYASVYGFEILNESIAPLGLANAELFPTLLQVARDGLDTSVGNGRSRQSIRSLIPCLVQFASEGLAHRGIAPEQMQQELARILAEGTDASIVRTFVESVHATPAQLEAFLIQLLTASVTKSDTSERSI